MKFIRVIIALSLIFVLGSCSEDTVPTQPNIPESERLDIRSAELYNQGIDVVDAAITINKEFSFEQKVLLQSLYKVGYSTSDLTKAIHIAYCYTPIAAEKVLTEILTAKTGSDIAKLILAEYIAELKSKAEDLKYFIQKLKDLEGTVIILKNIYHMLPSDILELLNEPDINVTEIIILLKNNFSLTEEDINEIIIKAKLTVFEIAGVLKSIYNKNSSEVMHFLTEKGYSINESLSVLKILYNLSVFQATALLEELKLKVSQIAKELINQNYSFEDVVTLLKDHFKYSPEETTTLLKSLNIGIENFVDELENIYNLTDTQLVATLNNVSYQLDEIINLLLNHFKLSVQKIIDILVSVNFDRCDILKIFKMPC